VTLLDLRKLISADTVGYLVAATLGVFGLAIYPLIYPHFGGAAVLEGYVMLKPEVAGELRYMLGRQPLPFVDQDERFLYVVACRDQLRGTNPAVVMIPLEFIAAASIKSIPNRFLAVPAYVNEHRCALGT
jgi:hypothetical protein